MPRIQIITLGIVFLGLFHGVSLVAIGEGKPPNLILIIADDVSADELSPYGGTTAARKRFEKYLEKIPLPDEKDPSTRQAWKRFRASPEGAPVKVFRPTYLD